MNIPKNCTRAEALILWSKFDPQDPEEQNPKRKLSIEEATQQGVEKGEIIGRIKGELCRIIDRIKCGQTTKEVLNGLKLLNQKPFTQKVQKDSFWECLKGHLNEDEVDIIYKELNFQMEVDVLLNGQDNHKIDNG